MIAILHNDGIVNLFIPNLIYVGDGNVIGDNAAARGTTADILIVDGFSYELEGSITNGTITLRPGDAINPDDFTDTRDQLPLTEKQQDKQRMDDLELTLADIIMGV